MGNIIFTTFQIVSLEEKSKCLTMQQMIAIPRTENS